MKHLMVLNKNVAVPMRDGAVLRANVFRPEGKGRHPVLMTLGPYGKDVHLSQFMPEAWEALRRRHPEVFKASSCKYLVFETPDPEMWVPEGYVVVKVDSRGSGKSPGRLDVNSPSEFRDFYDAIEWAAVQPWASGKVGLLGISYYAAGQWMIAAERPPHLAAMLPWQGTYDFYRDRTRQGGILGAGFLHRWWHRSVLRNQHGNPDTPLVDIDTGERNTGPESLAPDALAANRVDYIGNLLARPLNGPWYEERSARLERIGIPALVVANWGGLGLHLRGTILGWLGIASRDKWLKVQSGSYFFTFLLPQNIALQRKFFDRYLKDIDNGWENEPKVEVAVRAADDTVKRVVSDTRWPLSETEWTRLYLDASSTSLATAAPAKPAIAGYAATGEGVTFSTAPLDRPLEFAGPIKAKLFVSSSTNDMDLFATLRAFDPLGKEVTFFSAVEPRAPVSQGWLRVSQRKLDAARSTEWQPWHPHDESQKLDPGEIVEVDLEIWPASAALPAGYRLALTLQGKDFERPGETGPQRGSGWFLHDDPRDRPPSSFAGMHAVYSGGESSSYLLLPLITGGR
ncbi:MAG TPA: CocE/NonD family hydrolase [Burkholderiales bacterium]|nr:CocE/NonD family hydrolase [Burkholderiales bacterium]